ncbi:hypothetical protein [Saccharopolyspora hattusasensis]|uniref:hypothetical protein n=1 Tax=Saccharopolyspora hattusasensis TaxID=1128679 RepID=UPI003D9606BF
MSAEAQRAARLDALAAFRAAIRHDPDGLAAIVAANRADPLPLVAAMADYWWSSARVSYAGAADADPATAAEYVLDHHIRTLTEQEGPTA